MKSTTTISLFASFLLLASFQSSFAQTSIAIGPRASFYTESLGLAVGAEGRIAIASLPVLIVPSFDYFIDPGAEGLDFDDSGVDYSVFQVSIDALYEFGIDNQVFTPYAAAGITITRSSVDIEGFGGLGGSLGGTDTGLNIVGGANFEAGSLKPFAQLQINIGDGTAIGVTGGLLFSI